MRPGALVMVIALLFAHIPPALSHPGKVDRQGGHQCRRNCEAWGLLPGEYHLHDEQGNPIRLTGRRQAVSGLPSGVPEDNNSSTTQPSDNITENNVLHQDVPKEVIQPERQVPSESRYEPFPYMPALGLLLLLLILLMVRRKREKP